MYTFSKYPGAFEVRVIEILLSVFWCHKGLTAIMHNNDRLAQGRFLYLGIIRNITHALFQLCVRMTVAMVVDVLAPMCVTVAKDTLLHLALSESSCQRLLGYDQH